MRTINSNEANHLQQQLFLALSDDAVEEIPSIIKPLIMVKIDLEIIYDEIGSNILASAVRLSKHRCLAYFLDLGLDPFKLDLTSMGWSAAHVSVMRLDNVSLRRLMGLTFADPKFLTFKRRDGTTVETYLSRKSAEEQSAFREIQTIFYTYRSFHDSAERAANLMPPNHLLAALHYFLAASQMKTEMADKEDDLYLKRFHLKKVVMNLQKAVEHYYQAILEEGKTLGVLDKFDQCLTLSAEIIDSVEPDNPDIDWEIKLGDREFFDDWHAQVEALQKWREERRISFSSTSSETSGVNAEDTKTSEEFIRETDAEIEPLLDKADGLRYRRHHTF